MLKFLKTNPIRVIIMSVLSVLLLTSCIGNEANARGVASARASSPSVAIRAQPRAIIPVFPVIQTSTHRDDSKCNEKSNTKCKAKK